MSSFRDIGTAPLLTGAEEVELSRLIQVGMAEDATPLQQRRAARAKNRMVTGNIRLACNVAAKYHSRLKHLDIEDLAQEAVFGLYRAAEKFDPHRGYKFSTYAYGWINQSIRRAINNLDQSIRVPIHVHDQMGRFKKFAAENPGLSTREVAELSEASLPFIEMGLRARAVVSLNAILRNGDGRTELMDLQADDPPSASGNLMEEMGIEPGELIEFINHMDPREATALKMYYGLDGGEPATLAAIGQEIGVGRETVRQIRDRAARKVRMAFGGVPA